MRKKKIYVLAKREGDYVIIAESGRRPVNRAWWTPGGTESGFAPAFGITNELPDGRLVLFCERDSKDISVRDWIKAFRERGIPVFLIAETKRGYHAITRVRGSAEKVMEVGEQLAEWDVIDRGMLRAFTQRRELPFKQLLRISGKYSEPDVRVVRWALPIDDWERAVLALYWKEAKVEWSITRAAWGCPFYEPKASDEQLEKGTEAHRYAEAVLKAAGYETEVEGVKEVEGIAFRGKADGIRGSEIVEIKPPRTDEAQREAAIRQARLYLWLFEKKVATVMDYSLRVIDQTTEPLEPQPTLNLQPWFSVAKTCYYCANRGWCNRCLDLG
jgi:hypothetical protein